MRRDREGRFAGGLGVFSGDSCLGSMKLQKVVPDTDQGPFLSDRGQASSQELSEPSSLLDLTEDRFDDLFSFCVGVLAPEGCQLAFHLLARGEIVGRSAARSRRDDFAVLRALGSDEGVDVLLLHGLGVALRPIAGIGQDCPGLSSKGALDGGNGLFQLVDVAGGRGDVLRDDDLALRIHGHLSVVALDESVGGLLDLRLRVGKVPLGFLLGLGPLAVFAFGPCLCSGLLLQSCLGFLYLLQPTLPPGQFFGQLLAGLVHPVTLILFFVDGLGTPQQTSDLLLKRRLLLPHPPVAHRLVLGGVGLDLGPVHRHLPELDQTGLPAHQEYLLEEPGKSLPVPLAKVADRPKVRLVACRQKPQRHAVNHLRRDPTRRKRPRAVDGDQHLHHHPRVVRRIPSLLPVALLNRRKIQHVYQIPHKPCQMPLRHPLRQARRQQQQLIRLVTSKDFRHESIIHGAHQPRTSKMITQTASQRFFVFAPIVILKPSGSVREKSREPQGWSRGSWSSLPPRASILFARVSTFCVVVQYSRKPCPFLRSRPFFQSSCPIMKVTLPAWSETPISFPSCSQRSSTTNPRTSRYQARLFSRSFTVRPGDASLIFRAVPFAGAAFTPFEGVFFEGAFFAVFFTAISYLQLSFGQPMTRGLLGQAA